MATAGHILVKDVRRLRLPIALWLAVVGLRGWLVGSAIGSAAGDLGQGALFEVVEIVLPLLEIVFVCVLVVLAVQQDPLVGTDAFWLTRPIARGTLLASKLAFVALVVVFPQVVKDMAVMAANGVTARRMLLAIPEVVLGDLLVPSLVMVLSALTPNFARFVLAGVSVVTAAILAMLSALMLAGEGEGVPRDEPLPDLTSWLILLLAAIGAAVCVVAYQYRTRRTGRSIALALLGSLVALAAADLWAWPFLKAPEVPLPAELDPAGVRFVPDAGKTWVADAGSMRRSRAPRKHVAVRLETAGLPPGLTVRPIGVRSRLDLPGGVVLQGTRALEIGAPYEGDRRETGAALVLRHLLGSTRVLGAERYGSPLSPALLTVSDADFVRFGRTPGTLAAEIGFRVDQYRVVADLPLVVGARYDSGSTHVRVDDVLRRSDGCTVVLRESMVNLMLEPRARLETLYLLRNESAGEAVLGLASGSYRMVGPFTVESSVGDRMVIRYSEARFPPYGSLESGRPRLDERWLAGARLVRVESSYAGRFTKPLRIEGFRMDTR